MNKTLKNILITVGCAAIYLLLSLPLRSILSVFTVTDVRPAAVLNPILGIAYGLPAAIGIMIGNFIADYLSGYSTTVLIEGLPLQFIYTYIPYLMWKKLTVGEDHIHRLDSVKRVLKYTLTVFVYSLVSGIGVALIVWSNFYANFFTCLGFTFLNNFTMGMILGCPLMIVANVHFSKHFGEGRILSLNEKIIIGAAICEIISVGIISLSVYRNNSSVYDTWNAIYIYSLIAIGCLMLVTLAVMKVVENRDRK